MSERASGGLTPCQKLRPSSRQEADVEHKRISLYEFAVVCLRITGFDIEVLELDIAGAFNRTS